MEKRNIFWIALVITLVLICITVSCLIRKSDDNNASYEEKVDYQKEIGKNILDLDIYKNVNESNISSIIIKEFKEYGSDYKDVTDPVEINEIYSTLKKLKLGEKTNAGCDDNTVIYILNLKDNSTVSLEIECEWIVLDNQRYLIK